MPMSPRLACAVLITTALSSPTFVYAQTAQATTEPMAATNSSAPSQEATVAGQNLNPALPAGDAPASGAAPQAAPPQVALPQADTPQAEVLQAAAPQVEAPQVEAPQAEAPQVEDQVEVSVPGGEIVVTGRRDRNLEKSSQQVISILSSAEIARTGEGNIAGALGRVTGLSVVGSGYVYVRGLGDRYSLALLNGSPLPSPEPLKRVVPLDLFPSSVIASSLVQKSYSANFPGEFGGGVINLTTKAVSREPFFSIGGGISGDSETTGNLGYAYYGSKSDWSGYDNGNRDIPPALKAFFASRERLSSGTVDSQKIASELVTSRNALLQRWEHLPVNFSLSAAGAKSWEVGDTDLGIIASIGYSNKWQTRQPTQQRSLTADLSTIESDFLGLNTENRIVLNGLLGLGLEFGDNKLRWTNLYIHDTSKQTRLAVGRQNQTTVDRMRQTTAWYERQLVNSQLVGEFKLTPELNLDVRGGYANSKRKAPFELFFEYLRTNAEADPLGNYFVNRLNNGNGGDASVTFSDLNEDLWSASGDLSYKAGSDVTLTVGGAYSDTKRTSSRRQFQFLAPSICEGVPLNPSSCLPSAVTLFRPDYLLGQDVIKNFNIELIETDEGNPAFLARFENKAGYGKVNWRVNDAISFDAGLRYESALLTVDPIAVFATAGASTVGTSLDKSYWLPAATLTWEIDTGLQARLSGSKTIARPQFRELINQPYYDPESNREYRGNPLLTDSQLYNGEARVEWYYAPQQKVSLAGFYKRINNPIEAFINSNFTTSYANAPRATLYGAELDAQKDFSLAESGFFAPRKLVVVANYTFTKSSLQVKPGDKTQVYGAFSTAASDYFKDAAKMTGQSDHIVNLQLGLENQDRLSQQTILVTYASDRVISRGVFGSPPQPDVIERPGFRLDFVLREGVDLFGGELELKFEARNLTGRRHVEFQQSGINRLDVNSYDVGRSFSLSASMKF
jgi:outer membrane receptor protein involved in Fe transport